jgi:hypothetical protein
VAIKRLVGLGLIAVQPGKVPFRHCVRRENRPPGGGACGAWSRGYCGWCRILPVAPTSPQQRKNPAALAGSRR